MPHPQVHAGNLTSAAIETAADLPARLANREHQALEELIAMYGDRLARLAYRLTGWRGDDIDDIIQDVFARAWQHADRFRGHSSIWTWLVRLTVNACRTAQRRRSVRERLLSRLRRDRPNQAMVEPDDPLEADETATRLRQAIAALPATLREPCVLCYLEQMSADRIAEALNCTPKNVYVRLHRARARLRAALGEALSREDRP